MDGMHIPYWQKVTESGAEAGWGREGKKRRRVGLQTELEQRKREGERISILGINPSYALHGRFKGGYHVINLQP